MCFFKFIPAYYTTDKIDGSCYLGYACYSGRLHVGLICIILVIFGYFCLQTSLFSATKISRMR